MRGRVSRWKVGQTRKGVGSGAQGARDLGTRGARGRFCGLSGQAVTLPSSRACAHPSSSHFQPPRVPGGGGSRASALTSPPHPSDSTLAVTTRVRAWCLSHTASCRPPSLWTRLLGYHCKSTRHALQVNETLSNIPWSPTSPHRHVSLTCLQFAPIPSPILAV